MFRELLTYMLQDPSTIEPALDLILISRHLERIGDHATNIAEDVIFMVSARDVRHHAGEVGRAKELPAPSFQLGFTAARRASAHVRIGVASLRLLTATAAPRDSTAPRPRLPTCSQIQ